MSHVVPTREKHEDWDPVDRARAKNKGNPLKGVKVHSTAKPFKMEAHAHQKAMDAAKAKLGAHKAFAEKKSTLCPKVNCMDGKCSYKHD